MRLVTRSSDIILIVWKLLMTLRIRLTRPLFHVIIVLISFYSAYIIRLKTDLIPFIQLGIPPIPFWETVTYASIAVWAFWGLAIVKHLYTLTKQSHNYFTIFGKVRLYWIVIITFVAYFWQGFIFLWGISRFIIIGGGVLSWLWLLIFDVLRNTFEKRSIQRSDKKILILSDDKDKIKEIREKLDLLDRQADSISSQERSQTDATQYHTILAVGTIMPKILQNIMDTIRLSKSRFLHIAEWYFLEDIVYTTQTIWPIVALEYKHSKLDEWSVIFKRIFDIVFALCILIVLSPLIICIAIVIKCTSHWPVLYTQKRVGMHGKLFTFIKFRTMYTHLSTGENFGGKNADKIYHDLITNANERDGLIPKIANDPRVTRLGKFLRRTSLDELPQFLLILRWTMSVVWPRPHLLHEVEQYDVRQTRLLSTKPGITWYAQIFGRHKLNFDEEAKLDLYYIQHRSIRLDLYVIIMTIRVIFQGK